MWHSNNQKNKGSLLQAFVHTMKVGRIIDCICEYLLYMRCHFILNEMMMMEEMLLLSDIQKLGIQFSKVNKVTFLF